MANTVIRAVLCGGGAWSAAGSGGRRRWPRSRRRKPRRRSLRRSPPKIPRCATRKRSPSPPASARRTSRTCPSPWRRPPKRICATRAPSTIEDVAAERRRLHRPEPRPRPEPGRHARRLRRPDRARPAGRQGAGGRLPRRVRGSRSRSSRPTSTSSTCRASRCCAGRRAPSSAPARCPARCATSPTSRSSACSESVGELTAQHDQRRRASGGNAKVAVNVPLGDTPRPCGSPRYYTQLRRLHRRRAARTSASTRTSTTATAPAARVAFRLQPNDSLTITPRLLYQKVDMDGWNRDRRLQHPGQSVHHHAARRGPWASASSSPRSRSRSPTSSCSAT